MFTKKVTTISNQKHFFFIALHILFIFTILVFAPGGVLAKSASVMLPANAHVQQYGNGWECNRGYESDAKTCVTIKVPSHAYLNASGLGWECNRGFQKIDQTCAAIKVPKNGYLSDSSSRPGWKCDRGYRATDKTCVVVLRVLFLLSNLTVVAA